MPQEAGNDFHFADGRMDLLEELFAESANVLGLRCPAAVVIAPIYWRRHGDHFAGLSMCEEAHYVYMPKTDH